MCEERFQATGSPLGPVSSARYPMPVLRARRLMCFANWRSDCLAAGNTADERALGYIARLHAAEPSAGHVWPIRQCGGARAA